MNELLTRPETAMALFLAAVALTFYWILRKAPVGQSSPSYDEIAENAPSAALRDGMARRSVVGLTLFLAGGFAIVHYAAPWSIAALPLLIGGFYLINQAIRRSREYRHVSPGARRIMSLSNAALTASLLGGALWIGNAIAFKYFHQPIDFTTSGVHSLSERSVNLLATLKKPLVLTSFHGQDPRSSGRYAQLSQLLDLYVQANRDLVRTRELDRYGNWSEFETLAKKYPELALAQSGGLLIELGEGDATDHFLVDAIDLFGRDSSRSGSTGRVFEFNAEDAVTSALVRLLETDKPLAILTTGHGELSTEATSPNEPGMSFFKSRLEFLGVRVAPLNLMTQDLPESAALVVIAGPKSPFQPEEAGKLKSYLDRGGHALFFLGPTDSGLSGLLADYRIETSQNPVYDQQLQMRGILVAPIPASPEHPIVEPLARSSVLMPSPTAISIKPAQNQTQKILVEPIVRSGPQAWIESQANERPEPTPGKDEIGPVILGVAISEADPKNRAAPPTPRIVAFSSPYVAENGSMIYNQTMIINAVSWLRGKTELLGIPPKSQTALTLTEDSNVRSRLMLVPTLISFSLIVGCGIAIHLARRN